jgi:hypothetical protein
MENSNFIYSFNNQWGWFVDIESQDNRKPIRYKYNSYKPSLPTIQEISNTDPKKYIKNYDGDEDDPNRDYSVGFICCFVLIIIVCIYFL